MTKRFLELGGALLLIDRMQSQDPVMSLIERCRPLNGEFRVSTEIEFASASEMIAYLFEHREAEGNLDWSCDSGFIALEFVRHCHQHHRRDLVPLSKIAKNRTFELALTNDGRH